MQVPKVIAFKVAFIWKIHIRIDQTNACSKTTIETLEQGEKYIQS